MGRFGGGFPLFLTLIPDEGTVEFGGALLGASASTAADEGGLLAYFTFQALRTDAEITIDHILTTHAAWRGQAARPVGTAR